MARTPVPDALVMRHLKFANAPEGEKDRVAEVLRAEGRRIEALLLFEGRPQHPALKTARDHAVMHGAAFQLLTLKRLGVEITPAQLRDTAQAAERLGRWMDARALYRLLEDEEAVRRIAEHLPASLRPPPLPAPAPPPEPAG